MLGYNISDGDGFIHTSIILSIIRGLGCEKYLELGVYDASNISKISECCNDCVGVDISDFRKYHNFTFYNTTTDNFFDQNTEKFDVIFIDADHNFESVKKDFINSLSILNRFGIIFIHDTDPIYKDYINPGYCGDSYKIKSWLLNYNEELEFITLPIETAGLTIVKRKKDQRHLEYI